MIFPVWLERLLKPDTVQTCTEVEVKPSSTEAVIGAVIEGYVGVQNVEGVITQTIEVELHTNSFTVAPDNIYLIENNSNIPEWFQSILDNTIDSSQLSDEVSDLNNRFENFDDGVTLQLGYLQDTDAAQAYSLSNLQTHYDNNSAAIQTIETTKVDAAGARAAAETVIASWQADGEAGAWFDSKIGTVSQVAYSAAQSASTLTATMDNQQDQITAAYGDIETLQKQVDGVVETWFNTQDVAQADGDIILTAEPYVSWITGEDIRAVHTGDSYIKYELDAYGNKNYIQSYRFTKTTVDTPYTDADGYAWVIVVDSKAEEAYQAALGAQSTADGKINTYYQTYEPAGMTADNEGDIWYDSSTTDNKPYRYSGSAWVNIVDGRISASVDNLAEVSVDDSGTLRAKGSLLVQTDGAGTKSIAGYTAVAESGQSGNQSEFRIFADKFVVSDDASSVTGNPFMISGNYIYFNGRVQFTSVDGTENVATHDDLDGTNGTVINGGAISTNTINANKLIVNTTWINGKIQSSDFKAWTTGFRLKSNAAGTYTDPNIYGAYIRGGTIRGALLQGTKIATNDLIVITDYGIETKIGISGACSKSTSGNYGVQQLGIYAPDDTTAPFGTNIVHRSNNILYFAGQSMGDGYIMFAKAQTGTGVSGSQYADMKATVYLYKGNRIVGAKSFSHNHMKGGVIREVYTIKGFSLCVDFKSSQYFHSTYSMEAGVSSVNALQDIYKSGNYTFKVLLGYWHDGGYIQWVRPTMYTIYKQMLNI